MRLSTEKNIVFFHNVYEQKSLKVSFYDAAENHYLN